MNKKYITYLFCIVLTALSTAQTKTVVVFDIHGVLLREDVATLVEKKVASLLAAQKRGMQDNRYFKELCQLMLLHQPLGTPDSSYNPALGIPYEVYALFSGLIAPDSVYHALTAMLHSIDIAPDKKLIYTAIIETIFDTATRTSALTPIAAGIALFNACLASPDIEVFIYTNAPQEWIKQYFTLFPEIFSPIAPERVLASGATGLVKPDSAVFELLCQKAGCTPPELVLIDDSTKNTAATTIFGGRGLLFL